MATTEQAEPAHVIVHGKAAGFAQEVKIDSHELYVDEPASYGGTDTGPSPYDLLLAALGSCTSMTIGFYARKRRWPLENITVSLRHSKIHAIDCETGGRSGRVFDLDSARRNARAVGRRQDGDDRRQALGDRTGATADLRRASELGIR